jgi:hydrogenase maturation protease
VLVIGYGNTLRRDDGVGVRAAELLQNDPRLAGAEVLTVHQLTPELAIDIGAAAFVVFIDADGGAPPGEVSVRPLAGSPSATSPGATGPSSHQVGAAELMALAAALGGGSPPAWIIGIGVADLELGEGLSPAAEAALPRVVEMVTDLVTGAGP